MKYVLLCLLLSSCASQRISHSQKIDNCVEKYIDKNVKALESISVCEAIHGKKL